MAAVAPGTPITTTKVAEPGHHVAPAPATPVMQTTTKQKRVRKSELPDVVAFIVALFVPPLGVFLEVGCHADFWINILLTIFGYFPGILHALYVCFFKRDATVSEKTTTSPAMV